jgi:hypothetical protein
MRRLGVRSLIAEGRAIGSTLAASPGSEAVGPIGVSGMLAEQLVKQLAAGAEPGAVVVGGAELVGRADVLVRIVAGDPTEDDERLVRAADANGVPLVIVQLWPQADWTKPFVLTPFVVECRAGEGFPVREIADRVAEASEHGTALASRVPVFADAIRSALVKRAVVRSALIGLAGSRLGASRQLLTLEQVRLGLQLRALSGASDEMPLRAGGAVAVAGAGLALRGLARNVRTIVPSPVAQAAVAAAGTWALAKAYEAVAERLPGA